MPIVKHISIHASPLSFLEYIMNADKTADMRYASGINIIADVNNAYDSFKVSYERNAHKKFFQYTDEDSNGDKNKSKKSVRMHHYIQSFDPKENISPEEAHKIGMDWAKKAFGNDRMIVCTTHIDKGHIHNHFAVAPYSMNGKHWNANLTSLNAVRKLSDEIALQHGISVIENPNKHGGVKYKEWIEQKNKSSWKDDLRNDIDRIVVKETVNSLDDLLDELNDNGYIVRKGKYITIRPENKDRGVRTFRLGNGYSEQDLEYRLVNKDKEISVAAILNQYKGIQTDYALCIRQVQLAVYHKKPNPLNHSIRDVQKAADVLTWMHDNNIYSKYDAEQNLMLLSNQLDAKKSEIAEVKNQISSMQKIVDDYIVYAALEDKLPDITEDERRQLIKTQYASDYNINAYSEKIKTLSKKEMLLTDESNLLKSEYNKSSEMLFLYNKQMKDDFTIILEQIQKEKQAADNAEHEANHISSSYEQYEELEENNSHNNSNRRSF